jgi:hypothetical protein
VDTGVNRIEARHEISRQAVLPDNSADPREQGRLKGLSFSLPEPISLDGGEEVHLTSSHS